jgi:biotin carboxylase
MPDQLPFGFINPQPYMAPAIERLNGRFTIYPVHPIGWHKAEMDALAEDCRAHGIRAVGGFAQKDAFHHLLINEQLGNAVPSRIAFFYCMNKYLMRTLEQRPFFFAPVDPMHESDDEILARIPDDEWPFMLKNTSLSLGRGIFKISDADKLRHVLASYRDDWELQNLIASQTAAWLDGVDRETVPALAPPFIAEHYVDLNQCVEYCYEGYVTADGRIVHYALTEEIYFSDHQALGYLTPPMSISGHMADRIEAWVEEYMSHLVDLGYRNQFFNLEFWIMPDNSIALTEINPRAAHSYHYNYLYSFGSELYADNLLLAAGYTPSEDTPWHQWRAGHPHTFTLIVLITGKETGRVADILDYDYVQHLEDDQGVLIRHTKNPDDEIRDSDLTAAGVMLLQLWITGASLPELIERERTIRARIYRSPQCDVEYPDYWQ